MKWKWIPGLVFLGVFGAACWSIPSTSKGSGTSNSGNSLVQSVSETPASKVSPTPAGNTNMADKVPDKLFFKSLPADFTKPVDDAGRLLLREYGAVFVARGGAIAPKKVVFKDESDVSSFQATLQRSSESIGGFNMELQAPAMAALKEAMAEAKSAGVSITPRGADSARRGYGETVTLWKSRVEPGFVHWVGLGKVTPAEAARIKALSPFQQVPEILKLEQQGIYFAKDLSKSIIYSVAPPGTSQHLSMLALDVQQNEDAKVRAILAKHGWYQTVSSDLPHFTFLGVPESDLPGLGLKRITSGGRAFWVPDI
jgi:hypothetical protein